MTRNRFIALLCAGAVIAVALGISAKGFAGDDRETSMQTALAVQLAMQQGREFLQKGENKSAVHVLEGQLAKINGNAAYLLLMRDAYRGHIKDLRTQKQDAEAQRYMERLLILDPGAVMDGSIPRAANAPVPASHPGPEPPAPPRDALTARGKSEDYPDPFQGPRDNQKRARGLLAKAEEEFNNRRYREAGSLFDQAHQADKDATAASKERWGYCKLHRVVEQLKSKDPVGGPELSELEKEAREALALAPRMENHEDVKKALAEIDRRRGSETGAAVKVKHFERGNDGWARAETPNYRIYHNQGRELAEQVAQAAERTRTTMARKWFGGFKEDWTPRCDLYLHATAQDYSKATGVPVGSPGHSSFRTDGSRVLSRRIDLHCDDPQNMLRAVLPHEATHVVLAGQFGEQPIPRWADEGIAVLTEPRDKVERHLRNLSRCRQETGLYTAKQLMTLNDYPEPRYITVFYAQSVSLVEFMSSGEYTPDTFTRFLRAAQKDGYEVALRQHYGLRSFNELHQKWETKVMASLEATPAGVAQGGR